MQLAVDYTQEGVPKRCIVAIPDGVSTGEEFQAAV
jgi:hypothetical protein